MNPLKETQDWLEKAVIGLNLCPFAKAVHSKGQIRWVLSEARDAQSLLAQLMHELQLLASTDPLLVDTTLLVHPHAMQDFLDFNDFLEVADAALEEMDLSGTLQIAGFHPRFQFADTQPEDMGNYSNRSPYPTLHLLREDSVEAAVEAFPEAADIYERNIATLQALGPAGWKKLLGR